MARPHYCNQYNTPSSSEQLDRSKQSTHRSEPGNILLPGPEEKRHARPQGGLPNPGQSPGEHKDTLTGETRVLTRTLASIFQDTS